MAITKITMIKFVEIALTIIIFALHYNSFPSTADISHSMITTGTYVGYVIVLLGIFIGLFTGTPISARLDMFYVLIGAALYITAGVMSYNYFSGSLVKGSYHNTGMTKAWLSILNGIIFVVDAAFTYRGE
ncbi:uncharacterized protein LOC126904099 [Daktulosphaira vitifoliae]|uniref:uncharacterized protein LOC126904099 n=1 Tax=Daktulosphaira vitifoliae TaxID=58002 RepID=UPI0021A9BD5F|nr:uncharacterized protein LOC126904099 [Daktulosphaira vitifoliae]XP_050538780.1 uncharacterized protein LOC126904099 [Daktulosphaira vitifoliae]